MVEYPLSKDDIGSASWTVMHQRASQFPSHPSGRDRKQFDQLLGQLIDSLGCGECEGHARDYVRANPPDYSSREALFLWTVDFHDSVRARQGKVPLGVSVGLKSAEHVCRNCQPKSSITHAPMEGSEVGNRGILTNFDHYVDPVAKGIGLKPEQFVDAHVPAALGGFLRLIYDWQLSPFGSLLATYATSATMMVAGATQKASQSDGDQTLLAGTSAFLLWSGLQFANPKVSPAVTAGATAFGDALGKGDFGAALGALTGNIPAAPVARANQGFNPPPANVQDVGTPRREQAPESNHLSLGATPAPGGAEQPPVASKRVRFH